MSEMSGMSGMLLLFHIASKLQGVFGGLVQATVDVGLNLLGGALHPWGCCGSDRASGCVLGQKTLLKGWKLLGFSRIYDDLEAKRGLGDERNPGGPDR